MGPSEIYSFPCIIGLLCYLESKQGWGRYVAHFPIAGKLVSINLIEESRQAEFPAPFLSPPTSASLPQTQSSDFAYTGTNPSALQCQPQEAKLWRGILLTGQRFGECC